MSPRLTGNLVTVLGMALWATGFPATEILLESWHPLLLVPVRLMTASLVLLGIIALTGRLGELRAVPWREVAVIGGCGIGAATVCLIWGQSYSDPITVSIISTGLPACAAVMGFLAGDDRPTARVLAGVALAIAGGIVATVAASSEGPGFRGGEILNLGGVILFTWFTRASIRRLSMLSAVTKTCVTLGAGALFIVPVIAIVTATGLVERPAYDFSPRSLALCFYMGGIAVGCSMTLWMYGARLLGVTVAAIHQNTVPFWVMIFSVLFIGQQLLIGQVWGALLVIAGALLAQSQALGRLRAKLQRSAGGPAS